MYLAQIKNWHTTTNYRFYINNEKATNLHNYLNILKIN